MSISINRRIEISLLMLFVCLLTQSQTLEIISDSTTNTKVRLTNFEFGFNVSVSLTDRPPAFGPGVYIEPKYVNENLNEYGLHIAYNQLGNFYTDYEDKKKENIWRVYITAKKIGSGFFGAYSGIGLGLNLARVHEVNNFGSNNSLVLSPGILLDLGLHIGAANLGFKFFVSPQSMIGINLGFKF